MKLGLQNTSIESAALGIRTFYSFNSLTSGNVDYLLYKSTSHGINLVAEKATSAANYYWLKKEQNKQVCDRELAMVT